MLNNKSSTMIITKRSVCYSIKHRQPYWHAPTVIKLHVNFHPFWWTLVIILDHSQYGIGLLISFSGSLNNAFVYITFSLYYVYTGNQPKTASAKTKNIQDRWWPLIRESFVSNSTLEAGRISSSLIKMLGFSFVRNHMLLER